MTMSREKFEAIKEKWGGYSSWAIWKQMSAHERPKAGIGDMSVLDPDLNDALLSTLNPDVVMLGLNAASRPISVPFSNFHDSHPRANDFKIRYAFEGTPYWGSYMTDVFKGLHETDSRKVLQYLRVHPEEVRAQVVRLREELSDLGAEDPLLIVFGVIAYPMVERHLGEDHRIVRVTHYAHQVSKENYRSQVLRTIVESEEVAV